MFTFYKKFLLVLFLVHTHESIYGMNNPQSSNSGLQISEDSFMLGAGISLLSVLCAYIMYSSVQESKHEWDYTRLKSTSRDLNFLLKSHKHAAELYDLINHFPNQVKNATTTEKYSGGYLFTGDAECLFLEALNKNLNTTCFCINLIDFFSQYKIEDNKVINLHQSANKVKRFFKYIKRDAHPSLIIFKNFECLNSEYADETLDVRYGNGFRNFIQQEMIAIKNQLIEEIKDLYQEKFPFILGGITSKSSKIPAELAPLFHNHLHNTYDISTRAQIIKLLFKPLLSYTDITATDFARITLDLSEKDFIHLREEIINTIVLDSDKIKIKTASELVDNYKFGPIQNDTDCDTKVIAYHEAGHAILTIDLNKKLQLNKVSIFARGDHLGLTQWIPSYNGVYTIQDCLDEICIFLGGYAAEELLLSEKTLWEESSDYKTAYELATLIEEQLEIDALKIIEQEYQRAKKHLKKNKRRLTDLAHALLEQNVLMAEEVYTLFGEHIKI